MVSPKENGNGHRRVPKDEDRFSIYTTREVGAAIRAYCIKHRIAFNQLATEALLRAIVKPPQRKPASNRLQPGPRLRQR